MIATVSTEEQEAIARERGADHVIRYSEQDFEAETKRLTDGRGVDVVYDSVGLDTFDKSLKCLRPRGMMVSYGQSSGPIEPIPPAILAQKGSLFLTRPSLFHYIAGRAELEASAAELLAIVAAGKVRVDVKQRFALEHAADAHRALEARATTGSTILTV